MSDIRFYGTRGSFSLTSEKYTEFGGATTCIFFNLNNTNIMVDCGSGISNALDDLKMIDELHLFISHSHFDHICGIVELLPCFKDKKLHVYSKSFNDISIKESFKRITSESLWPVSSVVYDSVIFHDIKDSFYLNDIEITNMDSNHPGGCSLFRFKAKDDDIVTAFDFCHLDGYDLKLLEFSRGCKTLIYDGNFNDEELNIKNSWGHSTPLKGCELGKEIGVEKLYITHFGAYDDEELSNWEKELRKDYPFVTFARSGLHKNQLLKMIDLGTLFGVEKDSDKLLTKIVETAMDVTEADGGSLYLLENNQLEFKVVINKSKNVYKVRKDEALDMPPVSLGGKNICAASAREKKLINIEDCYKEEKYDFSGVRNYDKLNDYLTTSVLVVPLIDDNDDLIGVLQLINSKDNMGHIIPFGKGAEALISAIGNQAAMSIVNTSYAEKINDLLYGFVRVMSVGIDERTPYNAHHTKNMAKYANTFFDYENKNNGPYRVDSIKQREILMSIWLHDIGKLLTPLSIMNKDSRLGSSISEVENRYERRNLLLHLSLAKNEINEDEFNKEIKELEKELEQIKVINNAGFLNEELKQVLDTISVSTYKELDGTIKKALTDEEYYQLVTQKGTLTKEERNVMERHVSLTQELLSQLNFPKNYENIPIYAGNHHEFIDGSGYPNHLSGKDLPWPCRLITVLDIFEALTAKDRPYKKQTSAEDALSILYEMADQGKLDKDIIKEFENAKAWLTNE